MNRTLRRKTPRKSYLAAGAPCEPAGDDDAEIVRTFRDGFHDEAVRRLFQRHGGRVRAALRKRFPTVRDDHMIVSALHDAVRTVLGGYDPAKGASLGGWFLLIAGRRVCDALRGQREPKHLSLPLDGGGCCDDGQSPSGRLISEEFRTAVRRAMAQLSELERAVIEADIDAGGPLAADQLATSLNTTEQSIYAARARARRKLLDSPVLRRALSPLEP